jgi:hypothetical protein
MATKVILSSVFYYPTLTGNSKTYVKPEAAITVFELLMMGGMSPKTC